MNQSPSRRRRAFGFVRGAVAVAVLALGLFALAPGTASAAVPTNDNFASAQAIDPSSLPFNDAVGIDDASAESGEPTSCIGVASQTVWYTLTPSSDAVLRVTTNAPFYWQFASVFVQNGSDLSGLSQIACVPPWQGDHSATFSVQAGKTYYIQGGAGYSSSGSFGLSLVQVPPPPNDDFANSTVIGSLPFSETVDTSAGSVEAGEPIPSCSYTGQPAGTIWYSYTPSSDGWISASTFGSYPTTVFAAYSGSSLGSLTERACKTQYGLLTMAVQGGTTYHFLIGGLYGVKGNIAFQLDKAKDPVASFGWNPSDPSIYDQTQFYDFSYDPAGVGISSESWRFGDGTTATGCCPTHRYSSDGDYSVKLTVGTSDGRSASTTQVLHVKTHDVAISKLTVPQSAAAGQTRSISVGITDTRYPENVQVQLFKNDALVGTLTQQVPVRGANRTTSFSFNYTFTSDDAALGKVTFKAVATIMGARDALPSDNTAIALPTKVAG
jgi:PKD repeat protein